MIDLTLTFDGYRLRLSGTAERPLWIARDVACALQITAEKPWKGIAKKHLDHVEAGVNGTRQVMVGVDRQGLLKLIAVAVDRDAAARLLRVANDFYASLAKPVQTSLIEAPPVEGAPVATVDARRLHGQMGVGRDFSNWMRDQVEKHGFVEGEDFTVVQSLRSPNPASAKARPQPAIEYALTLDAAKRIKTAPNSPEAREVQGKLISAHERFSAIWQDDEAFLAEAMIRAQRKIAAVQAENGALHKRLADVEPRLAVAETRLAVAEPKASALDRIAGKPSDRNLQTAARQVFQGQPNIGIGRWEKDGLLYRDSHGTLLPYEPYLTAGYFRVVVTESKLDGRAYNQTIVTAKGLAWLAGRYAASPGAGAVAYRQAAGGLPGDADPDE